MKNIIYINGREGEEEKATINVTSEAFLFGCSVFETLRTYKGKFFCLKEHLERLNLSAKILEINPVYTNEEIEDQINKIPLKENWSEMKLRIILTKEELILIVEALDEKEARMYDEGVKLIRFEGQRTLPEAKKLGDVLCYLAKAEATKKGVYDSILIDEQGCVRECAYANIFWIKKGVLFTRDNKVLKGITRQTVIELAGKCQFEEIKYEELLEVDEIFITQTTSGILPVIQIEEHRIGSGKPGKITQELMEKWKEKVWKWEEK